MPARGLRGIHGKGREEMAVAIGRERTQKRKERAGRDFTEDRDPSSVADLTAEDGRKRRAGRIYRRERRAENRNQTL